MNLSKIFLTFLILGIGISLFSTNPAQAQNFIRGDLNCDGAVDSADVSFLENLINDGGPLPPCLDAADVNDDGLFLSLADWALLLRALDLGLALPPPFPDCGSDPTFDGYTCSTSCCTPACTDKPGDANGDGSLSLQDIIVIVSHVFKGGPKPDPACRGDADGDGMLNLSDLIYVVNFVFKNGVDPIPSDVCCQPT